MEVVHEICCGLDVHKKSITACIITPTDKEVKTFGTWTDSLLDLADLTAERSRLINRLQPLPEGANIKEDIDKLDDLPGFMQEPQKFMLSIMIDHIKYINSQIEGVDQEIERRRRPFEEDLELS